MTSLNAFISPDNLLLVQQFMLELVVRCRHCSRSPSLMFMRLAHSCLTLSLSLLSPRITSLRQPRRAKSSANSSTIASDTECSVRSMRSSARSYSCCPHSTPPLQLNPSSYALAQPLSQQRCEAI
jgi:hypothetical protein